MFLLTSIVLRCSDQVFLFCRMSLSWDLFDFFLNDDTGYWFGVEDHRDEVWFHHIISRVLKGKLVSSTHNTSDTNCVDFPH